MSLSTSFVDIFFDRFAALLAAVSLPTSTALLILRSWYLARRLFLLLLYLLRAHWAALAPSLFFSWAPGLHCAIFS